MTRILTWFILSCKRYGKRLSFLLILLLLPIGMAALGALEQEKAQEIRIAVYVQNGQEGELGERLAKTLASRGPEDGMFRFYLSRDEQQLREDVVSRRAECGYVIENDLEGRLGRGEYKRCITVYSAPSTVTAKLSTEVVFSEMMKLYDKDLLEDYVKEGELFSALGEAGSPKREAAARKAGERYDEWLGSGMTFHFEYAEATQQGSVPSPADSHSQDIFPVRGFVAVCLFIVGLYGSVTAGTDEASGLFLPLPYHCRIPCRIACVAGPVCMAAVSGLLAVWLGGSHQGMPKELLAMGGYIVLIVAFSCLLGAICRTPQALCCLIPFFIIGSMVFCPVILDTGRLFPVLQDVGKLFLPYYYLKLF